MANTATRLITLILLLQRQPNQKAAGLARELGVSVRTIHRYFAMLEEMGIPLYSERGIYGGFSLVRGYKMPPLILTPEEAVAIALGTGLVDELWGRLYHEAAGSALAKLDNLLPDEQRQEITWARRSLIATGLQRPGLEQVHGHLDKLRQAIRELKTVNLHYQGSAGPSSTAGGPVCTGIPGGALVRDWLLPCKKGYAQLQTGPYHAIRPDRREIRDPNRFRCPGLPGRSCVQSTAGPGAYALYPPGSARGPQQPW